jgi:hypothetical protein
MIFRFFLVVVALLFFDYQARSEEDFGSANYMLPYCRNMLSHKSEWGVWEGQCGGIIDTLMFAGSSFPPVIRFCPPKGVTRNQTTAVVLKYLEAHPERLHMDFKMLASEALHEAWPCRNG